MATSQLGSDSPPPYPSRQCRICFEECDATVELPPPGSASRDARVKYYSTDDPSLGQLISPCKCTGSAKYIHEGCLDAWRKKVSQRKHFWECNICHYRYQFSRLGWARLLENPIGHFSITATVALTVVFICGYIADPIINLYVDPYSAASSRRLWDPVKLGDIGENHSWLQHFYKGLASVGVLSFARVLLMANPWHWYNLRNSGLAHGTARPSPTGQERIANISWVVLVVGVVTFLYTLFKAMNSVTRWFLERAAFHIKEVPKEEDDMPRAAPAAPGTNAADSNGPEAIPDEVGAKKATKTSSAHHDVPPEAATSEATPRMGGARHRAEFSVPGSFDKPRWSFFGLNN